MPSLGSCRNLTDSQKDPPRGDVSNHHRDCGDTSPVVVMNSRIGARVAGPLAEV